MVTSTQRFPTLDDLRDYVAQSLCRFDQLECDRFPISERMLVRGGAPCGLSFCLHGPREVRFTAIWDVKDQTIRFYGPRGERLEKTTVLEGPALPAAASG